MRSTLAFRFPLASMIRYPAIISHSSSDGWLCYVDADMRIENPYLLDEAIRASVNINVVSHPGYTRPSWSNSITIIRNFANLTFQTIRGGLGDWEVRKRSSAFVPRGLRKTYVQAALFFGPVEKMQAMSKDCWAWTEEDLRAGIVPRWHDESYLNRWITTNSCTILGPEYCYFDFPWLIGRNAIVRAVDKQKEPVSST